MARIPERLKPWADLAGSYLWDNPVFVKELRLHFRSRNVTLMQGAYLALLSVLLGALTFYAELSAQTGGRAALWMVGKGVFSLLYVLHFALLAVLLPSVSAGMITGEREARTLELLDCLPMGKGRLVAGKFSALLVIAGLFLLSGIPLFTLALQMLGGVTPKDLVCAFLVLLGFGVLFTALGVLASSVSDSYRASVFLCMRILGLLVLLLIGLRIYAPAASAYQPQIWAPEVSPLSPGSLHQVPVLGPFASLLGLLLWIVPVPSTLTGALCLLALCIGLAGPLLTAAADHLRAPHERRPYLLMSQLVLLYLLIMGGCLYSCSRASWTPGVEFLLLEATCLFCLSAYALPQEKPEFSGWRQALSGGPRDGGLLVLACVLASYALWAAFFHGKQPSVYGAGFPASSMLLGQALLCALLPFWVSVARAGLRLWPEKARQLYIGALLLVFAAPLIANAMLSGPLRTANACLLALDPWLLLPALDPRAAAGLSRSLSIPQQSLATAAFLLSPLFAVLVWLATDKVTPRKRRR